MERRSLLFLSYARLDRERVDELYRKLSGAGFKPWMDEKDILPGETFRLAIERSIEESDLFLACLSANSVDRRGFIQREIKQALDLWQEKLPGDIYLIPVKLEPCELPYSLRDFQSVELYKSDGWSKLLRSIQEGLNRSG